MGDPGADDHAHDKDRRVTVPLPGKEELESGTAAGKTERQTRERHSRKIPQVQSMGDMLSRESRLELAEDEIDYECGDNQRNESRQEMGLTEENKIADGAHGAETAPLREKSDKKPHDERNH